MNVDNSMIGVLHTIIVYCLQSSLFESPGWKMSKMSASHIVARTVDFFYASNGFVRWCIDGIVIDI